MRGRKMTEEELIRLVEEKYKGKIVYLGGFVGTRKKCKWWCNVCKKEFWKTPEDLLRKGCTLCNIRARTEKMSLTIKEIVQKIFEVSSGTILLMLNTFIAYKKQATFYCTICGHYWKTAVYHVANGDSGCPYCAGVARKTPKEIEEDVNSIEGNNFKLDYDSLINTHKKAHFICQTCGTHIYVTPNSLQMGNTSCPVCSKRSMEIPVLELLQRKGIKIIYNKALKGSNYNGSPQPLYPDFLIEDKNGNKLCIECDGQHHFNPLYGKEALIHQQNKDRHKDKFLKEMGYLVIRIKNSDKWGTDKHILLKKGLELLEEGVDEFQNINLEVFRPYDFNRE